MNVRLLKPHIVNGQSFQPGTVLNLNPSTVRNLESWGGGEEVNEKGEPVRQRTEPGPIPVPQTKQP